MPVRLERMVGGVREREVRAPPAAVAVREDGHKDEDVRMPPAGDAVSSHQQEQPHEHAHLNTDADTAAHSNAQDDETAHALTTLGTRVTVPHTPMRGGVPWQSVGKGRVSFVPADLDDEAVFGGPQVQSHQAQDEDVELPDHNEPSVIGDVSADSSASVSVDGGDDEEEEREAALLGLVKITSADPCAAARAAAILKQVGAPSLFLPLNFANFIFLSSSTITTALRVCG
jgi:hypothetical protein